MIKRFRKYRPYALFDIDDKLYVLLQIGIGSWVLVNIDKRLLNNGMNTTTINYIKYKDLIKLTETDNFKFLGYLEYSVPVNEIQQYIFKMLIEKSKK